MKSIISGSLLLIVVTCGVMLASAVDVYQSKCSITEGAGIKVDSCDASQFLSCQSGRCMCNDIGNQLYDYRLEPEKVNSRSKRGLKKKIAAGVGAGAVVGYVAGKASSSGSSSSNKRQEAKYNKVFSCYGRVGSYCQLDYNNVNVVTLSTTSTTTTTTTSTPSPTTIASELSNVTTTSPPTSTNTPPSYLDVTKLPKCIRNAICTSINKASTSATGQIVKTDMDPRIGICECTSGYKVTTTGTDRCEKSGSSKVLASSLPIFISMFYALVITKYF